VPIPLLCQSSATTSANSHTCLLLSAIQGHCRVRCAE
jgi:hypothetical protein